MGSILRRNLKAANIPNPESNKGWVESTPIRGDTFVYSRATGDLEGHVGMTLKGQGIHTRVMDIIWEVSKTHNGWIYY